MAGRNEKSKAPSGASGRAKGAFNNISFINVHLSESQKMGYAKWIAGVTDIFPILDDVVASGYKVTSSYDDKGECYIATITNRTGEPAFRDHCFSLRARSVGESLARVLWVHTILCEGTWDEIATPNNSGDIW